MKNRKIKMAALLKPAIKIANITVKQTTRNNE